MPRTLTLKSAVLYAVIFAVAITALIAFPGCTRRYKGTEITPRSGYKKTEVSENSNNEVIAKIDGKAEVGTASYYGKEFHGKKTASGETFDMYALTAAHRTLPFGTKVKITRLNNGKSVIVVINDRGPYAKGRIVDLSYAAAKELDMIADGTAKVKLEVVE